MRKLTVFIVLMALMMAGCQSEPATKVPDVEPVATYDWMAGESPVPNERVGVFRSSTTNYCQAVSPQGTYFLATAYATDCYILYADHGSDTFVKLCGRPDCTHSSPDCNAYVSNGKKLSFYNGYLYVAAGLMGGDRLIRMDPDGSNHVTVLDLQKFAEDRGAEFANCLVITKGIVLFDLNTWAEEDGEFVEAYMASYMYKLDGSMAEPQKTKAEAAPYYHCGDVFFSLSDSELVDGGDSLWDWDPETDSLTYLTEYPRIPGYYGSEEAYYFRDGAVVRLTYATQTEETLIDTGLDGNYYVFCFPECMVLASRTGGADDNLYIYNWAYELVDTVKGPKSNDAMQRLLLAETAERFIFSDTWDGAPLYYINKSELGTGNAKLHSFKLPDL